MSTLKTEIEQLPFWTSLSEKEQIYLYQNAHIAHYSKGTFIQNCADTCLGLIYIIKGELRTFLLSEEGKEITLFQLSNRECCILSAACILRQITFDTQITAQTDCELLIIPSNTLSCLAEKNIYVKCFIYELSTQRFSSVMETMQQLLFTKLDHRLAAFLIAEYKKTGSKTIVITHEQIAQQINSAREVVARTLKRFAEKGLVTINRGSVYLKNPEALRQI